MTATPDWLEGTPEGRLSKELGPIINDVARWRNFMTNEKACIALYELIVAANELLPILNLGEDDEIDSVRYIVSAAKHADEAIKRINSIGVN